MARKAKIVHPKRGDVYLVNFDPTVGTEIRKTRPALIIQNDIANRYSPITIVAAITSQFEERLYPTEVLIRGPEGGLQSDSVVLLNQLRSVDKARLVKWLGKLESDTMARVDQSLLVSLSLISV